MAQNYFPKYYYELRKDGPNITVDVNRIVTLFKHQILSVDCIVDGLPSDNGIYSGMVLMHNIPIHGSTGHSREEVFNKLTKWLDDNFERKENY